LGSFQKPTSLVIVFDASSGSLGDTAHHLEELIEVNFSVAVIVDLSNG